MLDRKIKNMDANEELLQDRVKSSMWGFISAYFVGWFIILLSIFVPFKWDEVSIGIGLAVMIIGGYFLLILLHIKTLIYLKRQFEKGKNKHG